MTIFKDVEQCAKIKAMNDDGKSFCRRFRISAMPEGSTILDCLIAYGMFESKTRARKQGFVDEPLVPGIHYFKRGRYLFEVIE